VKDKFAGWSNEQVREELNLAWEALRKGGDITHESAEHCVGVIEAMARAEERRLCEVVQTGAEAHAEDRIAKLHTVAEAAREVADGRTGTRDPREVLRSALAALDGGSE
jgi:hypothetical protein